MRSRERVRRAPLVVFAVVLIVAFVTWLNIGRSGWFYIDEWDFIAGRKAGNLGDLFRPHNGHWTTLPALAFRALYATFGLRAYLPYRVVVVVLYLTAAALLLVFMRRKGVDPWIATAAASLFALFGAGSENILLPFQITFMGSFVFGMVHLLVADHDGPFDRRDWIGLLAGLCALMCSAVGLVMVAVVGGAVLVRRGWRLALMHVVPLAGCYAVWSARAARDDNAIGHFDAGEVARFVSTGVRAAFGHLGPTAWFGIVIAVVLVAGLALALNQRRADGVLPELAAPGALLVGAFALLVITAVNRSVFGAEWARQSRYVSLVAAMTLPALAIAADALTRRWQRLLPLAIAMFLVGIPANIHTARSAQRALIARDEATRATILSLPHDPLARRVPQSVHPEPTTASAVTIGWLLDAEHAGKLPTAPAASPALTASNRFRLSFVRTDAPAPDANCRTTRESILLELHQGDRIGVHDDAVFLEPSPPALIGLHLLYTPSEDTSIAVLRDAGTTRFTAVTGGPARVCIERA